MVNGKKVNIPSYQVQPETCLGAREGKIAAAHPVRWQLASTTCPVEWVEVDANKLEERVQARAGSRRAFPRKSTKT
jgi:ribosomal protein S4